MHSRPTLLAKHTLILPRMASCEGQPKKNSEPKNPLKLYLMRNNLDETFLYNYFSHNTIFNVNKNKGVSRYPWNS